MRDEHGFTTSRVQVCRPRSIPVVGSLDQFSGDGQLNRPMFESFERFFRSRREPEILTFDELHRRASTILALTAEPDQSADEEPDDEEPDDEADWIDPPF